MKTQPRIRYTKGPAALGFRDVNLKRGEWAEGGKVTEDVAREWIASPGRIEEIGAEAEGVIAPRAAPSIQPVSPAPSGAAIADPGTTTEE